MSRGSPKKYSRWWTSELSELRKGYRRLLRIFKSCNSLENEVNLRNAKKNYKLGILNAKKSDWNKFCADKPNLDPWNTIHKICKNSNAIVQPLHVTKDDGSKTNSVTEAGEVLLNKWFLKDDHSTDSNYHGEVRAELTDFFINSTSGVTRVSLTELKEIIKGSKPSKAPGDRKSVV